MRYLTVKRNKTFVGCACKLKVYVEDAASAEIQINDVGCRKLGELKNGEEKTFEISEDAAKVYVIADQLSKSYCNEYYQLPAGQEDIALAGQCKFNPATGNAFRFEGNNSAEVLANRKKSTAKGAIVLTISLLLGLICGTVLGMALFAGPFILRDKEFSAEGMSITLTNEFRRTEYEGYVAAYHSREIFVAVFKESFDSASVLENYSVEQYLQEMIEYNQDKLGPVSVQEADGLTGFVSKGDDPDTKKPCHYYYYCYKSEDAFWLIQFAVHEENVEKYEQNLIDWAKSVKFEK